MLKTLRKLWLVFFVIGSFVAILVLFKQESAHVIIPTIESGKYLVVAALIQIIFWVVTAAMWSNTAHAAADTNLPLWSSFQQLALVSVGKYLPGKVWGIIARGSHMARQGVNVQHAVVATLYEQSVLFHSAVVISAVLFATLNHSLLAILTAIAAVFSIYFGSSLTMTAVKCGSWFAWKVGLQVTQPEFKAMPRTEYLKLTIGYLLIWVLSGTIFFCLYRTFFERDVDFFTASGLILANAVAISLGFFAVFAPGAIGVREAIAASILTNFIPFTEAAVLVIVFRLWTIVMDALAGLLILLISRND